ncbi:MAG: hypothetical protein HFJ94_07005 [Muribaculaceae bacterium]|nr:hypothetical protein [Muribaculaceae bacterium]
MSHDIGEDEIRIIKGGGDSGSGNDSNVDKRGGSGRWLPVVCALAVVAAVVAGLIYMVVRADGDEADGEIAEPAVERPVGEATVDVADLLAAAADPRGFAEVRDTVVGGVGLRVFAPRGATPILYIGEGALNLPGVVLATQAADVRGDNGDIVGAYVSKGELLSKGMAKSGFCAIVGGRITIGVAESTPFLEQAIEGNGYFFRQYPLVVGGQVVENKPKGRALRKALAEVGGEVVVVCSKERMTFRDFSHSLVDMGVSTAIYLVGSSAYGFAVDEAGDTVSFGLREPDASAMTNYIVWRQGDRE